jgi:tuberculosinol/isotuberculosinol synthase
MDKETFQDLPLTEFARLVRAAGPKACVFPINGTRRWFMMEYPLSREEDMTLVYRDVAAKRHIELYRLFFEHGVDTLLTPIFGPDLLERGEAYARMATEGLALLATHADFVDFYDAYQVRVRFYGDYRQYFGATPYAYLADLFDEATARTLSHERYRLFFGVCAQSATEQVARLAVQYHAEHGCVPDERALIEMYYGEYIKPVDLFVGFDRFCVFDMPLLATGNEDLYFTVSPSPYLSERQLRDVLYDHLYNRRGGEPDYSALASDDWKLMAVFYRANRDKTLGVGIRRGQIWYPLPQVEIPSDFA